MLLIRGLSALRPLCVCAVLAGFSLSAQALQPSAPDDAGINLDQAVQSLKDEVLQFNRDAQLAEDEFLYPAQTRATVYVSNRIPALLLSELTLTVDGNAPVVYTYDEKDSRALLEKGALQPVARLNLGRGAHRLRAQFKAQYADADAGDEPVVGRYEAVFDKGLDAAQLELQILRGARKGTPGMKLKEWRAADE